MDLKQRISSLQMKLDLWRAANPDQSLQEVECMLAELTNAETAVDIGDAQHISVANECLAHATKVAFQIGVRRLPRGLAPGSK